MPVDRLAMSRFLQYCRKYASVEEAVWGQIQFDLPAYPPSRQSGGREQGAALALQERGRLGLADAPVRDIFAVLEHQGVKIYAEAIQDETFLGAFHYSDGLGPCMLVNQAQSLGAAFAAAHQYCHLMVDRESLGSRTCPDPLGRGAGDFAGQVPRAGDRDRAGAWSVDEDDGEEDADFVWAEERANAFACAFLMPARAVRALTGSRLGSIEEIVHASDYFGVPIPAVLLQLEATGLVTAAQRQALGRIDWADLASRLGYDSQSPLEPRRLRRLVLKACARQRIEAEEAASLLDMQPDQARELLAEVARAEVSTSIRAAAEDDVLRLRVGASREQHGLELVIDELEFTADQTRVRVTVKNGMSSVGDFSAVGAKATQGDQESEVVFSDFTEQTSRVYPGSERTGEIVFARLNPETETRVVLFASSADLRLGFEPFFFTIPGQPNR